MSASTYSVIYLFLVMAVFAGIVFWAYGKKRKKRFEQDAKIPFEDQNGPGRMG